MAPSTGSPASRRSTKLTPLTTRPSLTSRQGMTRTLSMGASCRIDHGERLGRVEPTVIKRAPRNRAGQALAVGLKQPPHVVDRGKAARRDDGDGERLGQDQGRLDIEPLEDAV